MPPLIHHVPDFLLAVLSCWVGLSLLVRAPHDRTARAFAWFCVNLAFYALAGLLPQLTSSPAVGAALNRLQLVATVIAPPAFVHFMAVLTTPRRLTSTQRSLIAACYIAGIALALYALGGPLAPPAQPLPWARWGEPSFPAGPLYWAWTAQRVILPLAGLVLAWRFYRQYAGEIGERRNRQVFAVTALLGVIGALAGTLTRTLATMPNLPPALSIFVSPAIPRAVILVGMIALTYAVLAYRALLPARVAERTFFYSILGSLITAAYVALLLLLEWGVRTWLRIDTPLLTIFALVALIAVLGPLREWFRSRLDRRFYRREFDYMRLLRTLGDDLFKQGTLAEQLQAALTAICRALGVRSGLVAVATPDGLVIQATYGDIEDPPDLRGAAQPDELLLIEDGWEHWRPAELLIPVRRGEERLALLALGRRRAALPFTQTEQELLDHLSGYLVLAIAHARARDEQQAEMAALVAQSEALQARREELARETAEAARRAAEQAAAAPAPPAPGGGLRVYALGPLRVERDGEPITRWGGDKAGTYQAEALFAFLFDRRGKGIAKDEAEEVIWPDLDIAKADTAFHRTIAALRRTLEPGLRRGNESQTVLYHHERYWLEPAAVAWCDTETFVRAAERGTTLFHQNDREGALAALEEASALYRGDYMDDCPFFGDSSYAEDQREMLRARYIEVQAMLGAIYESQARAGEATTAYRRALALNPEHGPAKAGLARVREGVTR